MTLNEFLSKAGDLFKSNAADTTQLSAVQTEVTTLKAQLEAKDGELSKLSKEATDSKAALEAANATHTAALEAVTKERDEAKAIIADPKAHIEQTVSMRVAALAATVGAPPVAGEAGQKSSNVLPRAEFEALSHPDRNAFMRAGGKIV